MLWDTLISAESVGKRCCLCKPEPSNARMDEKSLGRAILGLASGCRAPDTLGGLWYHPTLDEEHISILHVRQGRVDSAMPNFGVKTALSNPVLRVVPTTPSPGVMFVTRPTAW